MVFYHTTGMVKDHNFTDFFSETLPLLLSDYVQFCLIVSTFAPWYSILSKYVHFCLIVSNFVCCLICVSCVYWLCVSCSEFH